MLLQDSGDIERGLEGVEGVKQTPVDVMVSRSWFFSCCGLVFIVILVFLQGSGAFKRGERARFALASASVPLHVSEVLFFLVFLVYLHVFLLFYSKPVLLVWVPCLLLLLLLLLNKLLLLDM